MANNRLFVGEWSKVFLTKAKESSPNNKVNPGNFYKIEVYKYTDGVTRTLSGIKTAYVFIIGKYTRNKQNYYSALKLSHVDPKHFFNDIKLMFSNIPITSKKIDEVYGGKDSNRQDQFSDLLKKIPKDGSNLYSVLKNKKRIFEGNYREYILTSIKSIKYLDVDPNYLKATITKDSNKSENIKYQQDTLDKTKKKVEDIQPKPKKETERVAEQKLKK